MVSLCTSMQRTYHAVKGLSTKRLGVGEWSSVVAEVALSTVVKTVGSRLGRTRGAVQLAPARPLQRGGTVYTNMSNDRAMLQELA